MEEEPELGEGIEDREVVAHGGSGHGIVAQTDDGLSGSPVVPWEKNRRKASIEQDAPASSEQDHSKVTEERDGAGVPRPVAADTLRIAPPATGGSSAWKRPHVEFPDHVEFKYDGDTPLSCASEECAELVRQVRGGANDIPSVKDLSFWEPYIDAARTKVLVRVTAFFNSRCIENSYLILTLACVCAE